ncbi:unnamed protein product [Pleuronectes platessa]|uniref:Uncharacterized protein n=1 Tax=Pleuronectes platessa TaxID=8262 RepID=A0A9N7VTL4_PLEPL|nr:unnamed protein product [Pleuronectes platessa]
MKVHREAAKGSPTGTLSELNLFVEEMRKRFSSRGKVSQCFGSGLDGLVSRRQPHVAFSSPRHIYTEVANLNHPLYLDRLVSGHRAYVVMDANEGWLLRSLAY